MHSPILLSIAFLLSHSSFVYSHPSTLHYPRQDKSSLSAPGAGIETVIHAPDGTDITSAFQILLYQGSSVGTAQPNLTDRDLSEHDLVERQGGDFGRPIISCRRWRASFTSSVCDYRSSFTHSLQRYKVNCRYSQPLDRSHNPAAGSGIVIETVSFSSSSEAGAFYSD